MNRTVRFLGRLLRKANRDDIFFMSGAIAFNLIVAVLPLLVFALGVAGFVLQARSPDPGAQAIMTIRRLVPPGVIDGELLATVGRVVNAGVAQRAGFSLVGSLLLLFFSTRLAATLRSVLRVVFEVPDRRPLVRAKLHDVQIVLVGGLLILLDLGATALGTGLGPADQLVGLPLTLFTMWVLFALVFRYVPARPTPWRTVWVGATTAAVSFALMRLGFGLYLTRFATFTSGFGSLATLVVLYLFLYYSAVLFVLSGEAAFLSSHPEGQPKEDAKAGHAQSGDSPTKSPAPQERIPTPDPGVVQGHAPESSEEPDYPQPAFEAGTRE